MCVDKLTVKSNIKNYDALFEGSPDFVGALAKAENAVYVVDENVWNLHKDGILAPLPRGRLITLPVAEEFKNMDTVCGLYEKIMEFAPRKNLNLVSIGGGITQDITGFVASSLYRGVNWIFVPTTFLAQVDSCIGAKTSLNFKRYKNLVGTFYPPSRIHIFPEFLRTLTKADFYSGVGEMAKLHLMDGAQSTREFIQALPLVDKLDLHALLAGIKSCLRIKKSYIELDEFDTGRRNMLNYGHCIGHAIESATNFAISHGQAVVVGMIAANIEAARRKILSAENEEFIRRNVLLPVLKVKVPEIDTAKTVAAMAQDKKNLGKGLALVMLADGHNMVKITDLSNEAAAALLEEFKQKYV